MKIKVKEKFVDSISGKKIYANKAENTTNGLNIDDSISSLSSTIKTKQNKLTFAGEDNTITAINNSAVGGGTEYTAGTDISIINGVIKVSTNGEKIGNLSFVEGCQTSAVGSASHAEGRETSAVGEESHAEGSGTSAIGRYSHSEGRISLASGQYSHAEGDNTSALNFYGHAEGDRTLASGEGDHAEGHMTSAIGRFSHAEGWQTIASGYYQQQGGAWAGGFAHSEGERTSALGQASHAEGYKTLALSTRTHAEGEATSAVGINTHAEGTQTSAVNQDAHAECYQTSAIGYGSHSEGCRTKASGDYSHAEGENAIASGKDSHAGGCYTTAQGNYSYTEGYHNLANGSASHAEGAYTQTNSPNMHAQGTWNKTTENVAFVIGNGSNAYNKSDAFIVDWNGTASATKLATSGITDIEATINSLASVGGYAVVASTASITNPDTKTIYLVKDTAVTGDDQYKEYICTNTATPTYEMIGDTSIDLDNYYTKDETYNSREIYEALTAKQDLLDYGLYDGTTITAIDSYPVGRQLTAGTDLKITNYNISVDTDGKANGTNSFVAGKSTSALGNYSMAFGYKSEATAVASFAEGLRTSAYGVGSHAEGGEQISVLSINGTLASGIASHSEGVGTSAIGNYSHAEGKETSAKGDASHAEGHSTSAIGDRSHAAGCETIAKDDEMFVCGRANATTSGAAFVVGNGSLAIYDFHVPSDAFIVDWDGNVSATGDMYTSAGQVVTDVMLTSATNSTTSFVTNGVADLTPLYTYIKSLEDRIAALEAAQGGFTVNGIQPTVNGNTITVGE